MEEGGEGGEIEKQGRMAEARAIKSSEGRYFKGAARPGERSREHAKLVEVGE